MMLSHLRKWREHGNLSACGSRLHPTMFARLTGLLLVDADAAFVGREAEYVDEDDLHLRPPGNDAVARPFFSAIQQAIPATTLRSVRQ